MFKVYVPTLQFSLYLELSRSRTLPPSGVVFFLLLFLFGPVSMMSASVGPFHQVYALPSLSQDLGTECAELMFVGLS